MELNNRNLALILPKSCVPVTQEEMQYLEGGCGVCETYKWANRIAMGVAGPVT